MKILKVPKHVNDHVRFTVIVFSKFMVYLMIAATGMVAQAVTDRLPIKPAVAMLVIIMVGLFTVISLFIDMTPVKPTPGK